MSRRRVNRPEAQDRRPVRCAIYTRKSTDEGLDRDFNTLDAQRECGEAYVASQKNEGWTCLPHRYDDGGYSGGTVERPALQRLLKDIDEGLIDGVVVYKVDRLSRSLVDFARFMERFDEKGVKFVSVTQQFNTADSMGRLTMNVLLSFAHFEREVIAERTRDKIAAAKRKGKWCGGRSCLGYDVDRSSASGPRLVVNEDEARRVRDIFNLYLEHGSLGATVRELNRRGWTTKRLITKDGREQGGRAYTKNALFNLLSNPLVIGKVSHKGAVHEGEHEAIVDDDLWTAVQAQLVRQKSSGGAVTRNRHGALLRGLLVCSPCGCSMTHSFTGKGKLYRYYVCARAQREGWDACPSKSIPAGEIEAFVLDQVRGIGSDPVLAERVMAALDEQSDAALAALRTPNTIAV